MLVKCVLTTLKWNRNQHFRDKNTKLNICHHMFTSSTQWQNRSFHVVEGTRTSAKCRKMKNARAKLAKRLFFIVKYAILWSSCCRRRCGKLLIGSLSTRVSETGTATGREHFSCQDSGASHIFILIIPNGEKVLSNVNAIAWRRVIRENRLLPFAVCVSKSRLLKLRIDDSSNIVSKARVRNILFPRGCDLFGQRHGSRPLAGSNFFQSAILGHPVILRSLMLLSKWWIRQGSIYFMRR